MKLSNENVNATQNKIDRDIRMLECIESMHKKMEYEVSCEDPNVSYISIDGLRLIFENGVYMGWYIFEEDAPINQHNIVKLKKTVMRVFPNYCVPNYVDINEYGTTGDKHIRVVVSERWPIYKQYYADIAGSIDFLSSLTETEFAKILKTTTWNH